MSGETYTPSVSSTKYWKQYERLLHCCGKTAYYWRMRKNYKAGSPKVKKIAREHDRSIQHYKYKCEKWKGLTKEASKLFNQTLKQLGNELSAEDERNLLNNLTLNPDYRACCYDSLEYGRKKGIVLSLAEIDARYDKRLKKREKR